MNSTFQFLSCSLVAMATEALCISSLESVLGSERKASCCGHPQMQLPNTHQLPFGVWGGSCSEQCGEVVGRQPAYTRPWVQVQAYGSMAAFLCQYSAFGVNEASRFSLRKKNLSLVYCMGLSAKIQFPEDRSSSLVWLRCSPPVC